tara:strand:- start:379 stop:537 length:159 start_codon:yes stop_codon:yes gene_type:complete
VQLPLHQVVLEQAETEMQQLCILVQQEQQDKEMLEETVAEITQAAVAAEKVL